jgi:hypothetical protein
VNFSSVGTVLGSITATIMTNQPPECPWPASPLQALAARVPACAATTDSHFAGALAPAAL